MISSPEQLDASTYPIRLVTVELERNTESTDDGITVNELMQKYATKLKILMPCRINWKTVFSKLVYVSTRKLLKRLVSYHTIFLYMTCMTISRA
ncbi:hypothetical protein GSD1FS_1849 [Bifidobacterium sp. GSD1FS]|uniref:Uncharacterized protein n=1 Tax=Bifidobacterium canis TaxID=2610880 RepID=A0A7K1J732_9BIFI|nr:hypothetical protein [Bifidobacterium canis]